MKQLTRFLCRLLIVAVAWTPVQFANAGMIGTGDQVAVTTSTADRTAVLALVTRDDVSRELQAFGVDPKDAQARIAAMSDSEVASMKADLEAAPAGADAGWILIAVLVGALIYWVFMRRN
jgi:hypothetical protein